jgi:hypothetical protein
MLALDPLRCGCLQTDLEKMLVVIRAAADGALHK